MSFLLCVSASTCSITNKHNEDYSVRLPKFKECGLINIRDKKIKVFLLVGNEDIPGVEDGWECDTEVIKCDWWHNAPKTHDFFATMTSKHMDESRWLMKVDDDSATNVSDLIDIIDKNFIYYNEWNITGSDSDLMLKEGAGRPQDDMYIKLVRESDYADIIENRDDSWLLHEWEHNILSQAAVKTIFKNKVNIDILKESLIYGNTGRSDHLITLCANLSGVPFKKVGYMSYRPYIKEFFSGKLLHIHYLYEVAIGGSSLNFRLLQSHKDKIPFQSGR